MSMSDAQQHGDAQHKQAFNQHLPYRIAAVQRRLLSLCDQAWDINTLYLIHLDVQQLASTTGDFGMVDVSNRLFTLEGQLGQCLADGDVPDDTQGTQLRKAVSALSSYSAAGVVPEPSRARPARLLRADQLPPPAIDDNGLPSLVNIAHFVRPPDGFILAQDSAAPTLTAAPGQAEAPPTPEPEPGAQDPFAEAMGIVSDVDDEPLAFSDEALSDFGDDFDLADLDDELGLNDAGGATPPKSAQPSGGAEIPAPTATGVDDDTERALADLEAESDLDAEITDADAGDDPDAALATIEAELGLAAEGLDADEDFEDLDALFQEIETVVGEGASATIEPAPTPPVEPPRPAAASSPTEDDADTLPMASDGRRQLTIYLLHGGDETPRRLQKMLAAGNDVQSFTSAEDFLEILGAIGPDAVIVDDAHLDRIEEIGGIVRKLRAKTHGLLPLIALSTQRDVGTRLKLMRAGADAFLPADGAIDELADRVWELLHAAPEEPYRVLIVEDDRSQALFAQSILKRAGLTARIEREPMKVVEVMDEFRPDLVLMDLHMPGCDGMELTAIVRERDQFTNTPIVFLSGEDDEDIHFDALLAGGDDFLSKPIRPRHLISAVKNRVRRARAMSRTAEAEASSKVHTVTGLVDRAVLLDRINHALADLEREEDKPGGVIYFEVDRPFELRRELGLSGFESLTAQLAPLVTDSLREEDTAARYGDNAYCLLVPARSRSALERRARATVDRVAEHAFELEGRTGRLTISAGICPLDPSITDAAIVIGNAEHVCNLDTTEPSRITIHQLVSTDEHQDVRETGELITEALDENRFEMVYQPIASLQGEDVEHYQCLLRLPRRGMPPMSPPQVLEAAEQLGMIGLIDRWVLRNSIAVLAASHGREKSLRLFVNQSAEATRDEDLPEWLGKAMEEQRVAGTALILEFKLPEIVRSLKPMVRLVDELSMRRIRFCLGGFDGSDTAFQVLSHVAAEFVKLAPPFVHEHLASKQLSDVIARLHQANARVIVPAVEEAESAIQLWSAGVDYIQGNFIQQPAPDLSYHFANAL